MNKHSRYVALVGLLAVLLMPSVSHAQPYLTKGGDAIVKTLSREEKGLNSLRQHLTNVLKTAAIGPTVSAVQYTFAGPYPDLSKPSDVKELKRMLAKRTLDLTPGAPDEYYDSFKYTRQLDKLCKDIDLSEVTIDDIARAAAHARNEKWAMWTFNLGVSPRVVFTEAAVNTLYMNGEPMNRDFTERLISHYGVNPNAERPGEPGVLLDIITNSKGQFPDWFLDLPDVNPNVLVNNQPLIFATPNITNGEDGFQSLAFHVDLHTTNSLNQTPVHTGARYFSLRRMWKIPQDLINKPDIFGNTPAHCAAMGRNAETGPNYDNFQWLTEHGADLTIRNNNNQTPIDVLNESIRNAANAGK